MPRSLLLANGLGTSLAPAGKPHGAGLLGPLAVAVAGVHACRRAGTGSAQKHLWGFDSSSDHT